jgi:type III pantothenate kinase
MKPLWVSCYAKLGIGITYPNPESIGADRLANAVGGVRKYGAPVVIADFGTAVTFDVVSKGGGYIGGIIAPGLPLMFDYLAERTAQLPQLSWKPVRGRVGKSTTNAMQLGAHWGYRGMVREILQELKREPKLKSAVVCATGGYAAKVLSGIKPKLIIEPTLTLFGIGCIYELNR